MQKQHRGGPKPHQGIKNRPQKSITTRKQSSQIRKFTSPAQINKVKPQHISKRSMVTLKYAQDPTSNPSIRREHEKKNPGIPGINNIMSEAIAARKAQAPNSIPISREMNLNDLETIMPALESTLSSDSNVAQFIRTRLGNAQARLHEENRHHLNPSTNRYILASNYVDFISHCYQEQLFTLIKQHEIDNNVNFGLLGQHEAAQVIASNLLANPHPEYKQYIKQVSLRKKYQRILDNLVSITLDVPYEDITNEWNKLNGNVISELFNKRLDYYRGHEFRKTLKDMFIYHKLLGDSTHLSPTHQINVSKYQLLAQLGIDVAQQITESVAIKHTSPYHQSKDEVPEWNLHMPLAHVLLEIELLYGIRLPAESKRDVVVCSMYLSQKIAKAPIHPTILKQYQEILLQKQKEPDNSASTTTTATTNLQNPDQPSSTSRQ